MFDSKWNDIHATKEWGIIPDQWFIDFVDKEYPEPATFLDLGCAVGAQTLPLAEKGHTVIAVDGSLPAIERLSKKFTDEHKVIAIVADISEADFKPQCFDCIVDICTLQMLSWKDASTVIQRAKKWLKPNGIFFSKMATSPHTDKFNRGVKVRLVDIDGVKELFEGYNGNSKLVQTLVRDELITHWVTEARLKNIS